MTFSVFAAIAQFEREIIRERINAGLARAKSEGKKLGRPSNVNDSTKTAVKLMREKGASIHRIAKELRIGVGTTSRILKAAA
jgi:putative DNA-invertase from lambdoid prophage Rac